MNSFAFWFVYIAAVSLWTVSVAGVGDALLGAACVVIVSTIALLLLERTHELR